MKSLLTILCFGVMNIPCIAQTIAIGEKVPDVIIKDVLNSKDNTIQLSAFQGKYIIMNFWNQGCIANIQKFPELETIQKLYNDELQIIMVNPESKDTTEKLFKVRPKLQLSHVPFITAGKETWKQFNSSNTPYQVWIDKNGIVQYITNTYNFTRQHVSAFIKGERPFMLNVNSKKPVAVENKGAVGYSSILLVGRQPNNFTNTEGRGGGDIIRLSSSKTDALSLFKKAYQEFDKYDFRTPEQIVWEVKDKTPFIRPMDINELDEWSLKYSYSYELTIPAKRQKDRYKMMQEDLKRYFDVLITVEKRKVNVLALVKDGNTNALRSEGGNTTDNLLLSSLKSPINDSLRTMINVPFKLFSEKITQSVSYHLKKPVLDKTGISDNVDVVIRAASYDPFNFSELQKDLKKYNLKIIKDYQMMDVLVIKDK